jgi:excisionase family DNA binding protein
MPEPLAVSVNEAAEVLGVGKVHMTELIRDGKVAHIRSGSRVLVPLKAIAAFIDEHMTTDYVSTHVGGRPRKHPVPA